jgi:hypothetical protein
MRVAVHTSSTFCLRGLSTNMLGARKAATRESGRAGGRRRAREKKIKSGAAHTLFLQQQQQLGAPRRRKSIEPCAPPSCVCVHCAGTHPPTLHHPLTHPPRAFRRRRGAHNSFLPSLVARSLAYLSCTPWKSGWLALYHWVQRARRATGENKNQLPFRPFSVARERENGAVSTTCEINDKGRPAGTSHEY